MTKRYTIELTLGELRAAQAACADWPYGRPAPAALVRANEKMVAALLSPTKPHNRRDGLKIERAPTYCIRLYLSGPIDYCIRLYLSGPIEVAKQVIREDCLRDGLCVTIEPTSFIYTGGEEAGYVVGLLNYPRFPSEPAALRERAHALMGRLLDATFQHSALMVTPEESVWITKREA